MKKLFVAACLIFSLSTFAQTALEEMIAAEKSFAAYAVANNTVDAFLKFMDTSAVMFKEGEPYKAYQNWQKREKRPGVLNWWPRYAEVAASGDWGYTCGPWTFQPQTAKDSVIANGYFFTVWQKNRGGEWKFILDVGVDAGTRSNKMAVTKLTKEKTKSTEAFLRDAEENFLRLYKTNPAEAYQSFLSSEVILTAEGTSLEKSATSSRLVTGKGDVSFVFQGGGIAPSGDLGYAYGSATLNGKKETYLRIWRHEPSGWKIALQMVRL